MAHTEFLWRKRCSTSPSTALCQDLIGHILNGLKNGLEMKNDIFSLVPWLTVQLHKHVRKEGSWRGCVCDGGRTLFPPILQTKIHRVLALHPGPPHCPPKPRLCPQNKQFHIPSSAQWTQGCLREAQRWGFIRGKGHTAQEVKEGSRACLRAMTHQRDSRKDKWDVVTADNWERCVNLQEI